MSGMEQGGLGVDKAISPNMLSHGVTLDDFWTLGKKPYMTKDGVYKKPDQNEQDAQFKSALTEEEEEKRSPPRLVILKTEVARFVDEFWPQSELQKNEATALVDLFFQTTKKPKGYLTRTQFKNFIFGTLDMYDPFLCERMFVIFDRNKDDLIDYEEWTHGMHTILVGSIHEQLKYCFLAYDLRGKGHLEPEDIRFWIKRSYYNLNPMTDSQKAEFYEDIYRLVMHRIGKHKDDYITFKKYRTAVCEHPSLMQLMGAVLPDPDVKTRTDVFIDMAVMRLQAMLDACLPAVWKVNDVLFPRFFCSKHLMLFPRGDVPKKRDIKFDPALLMKRYPQTQACYPPRYIKGPDGKPMLRNAKAGTPSIVGAGAGAADGKEEKPVAETPKVAEVNKNSKAEEKSAPAKM